VREQERKLEGSPSDGLGTNCTFAENAETIAKFKFQPDCQRTRAICGLDQLTGETCIPGFVMLYCHGLFLLRLCCQQARQYDQHANQCHAYADSQDFAHACSAKMRRVGQVANTAHRCYSTNQYCSR